ncbi:MAG: MFS transporter [Microbacteriaceae bacterium]|nr:MFS transporter [Microbacteriaceae bacterium]
MSSAAQPTPSLTAWRNALFVTLGVAGLAVAALLSRMPSLRDHLQVDAGGIGLMLACFSIGSLTGLAFSGPLLHVLGPRRLIRFGVPVYALMLALVGVTAGVLGSYPATAAVSFVFGAFIALADVGTNVEGSANERAAGKSVMPFLHAGFSLGTVVGAGLGALAAAVGLPIFWHFGIMAAILFVVALVTPRWIPSVHEQGAERAAKPARPAGRRSVWREPRTLLIGVLVLAFAYVEGAANDWLTLALVDERGFEQSQGALLLAVFTAAMTAARFAGSWLVDRFGRVAVLVCSGVLAGAGLALLVWVPETWAIVVGTIVWGAGSSLGFPLGMSAAGDDPVRGPQRVAAVSVIGYAAFFAGPPAVGFLAEHIGLMNALAWILVLVVIAVALSPVTRPTRPDAPGLDPDAIGADPATATTAAATGAD